MLKRESTATAMCDGTDDPRMNVTVIDYGVGNLRSLQRGLERADATVTISDDLSDIAAAKSLVLPGVGAFEACMRNSTPFHDVLVEKAADTPILGICVGFQLTFTESTEAHFPVKLSKDLISLKGRSNDSQTR